MKVGDDVVAVVDLLVERDRRHCDPRQPADDEVHDEPDDEQHRGLESRGSGQDRRDPGKQLDRRRDHDDQAHGGEVDRGQGGEANGEHVVHPHAEAQERDQDLRQRDQRKEHHLAFGERRDDRGGDPERGQDDYVYLWMAKDPEQVLPQQRITAERGVVEVKAELTVEL